MQDICIFIFYSVKQSSEKFSKTSEELKESCFFFLFFNLLLFKKPTFLCFIGVLHLRCSEIFAVHQMQCFSSLQTELGVGEGVQKLTLKF